MVLLFQATVSSLAKVKRHFVKSLRKNYHPTEANNDCSPVGPTVGTYRFGKFCASETPDGKASMICTGRRGQNSFP